MENKVFQRVREQRLLKAMYLPIYEQRKKLFLEIYDAVLDERNILAKPYIINSHQARMDQYPDLNAIICDVHYYEIAWLLAVAYHTKTELNTVLLSEMLISDSLLFHGNPILALEYAEEYSRFKRNSVIYVINDQKLKRKVNITTKYLIAFAIGHEIAHFYCDDENDKLVQMVRFVMRSDVDDENDERICTNSIDLSPIQDKLECIKLEYNCGLATGKVEEVCGKLVYGIKDILEQYEYLIPSFGVVGEERKRLILRACDDYIIGVGKEKLLPLDVLVTEGTCDLLSLFELFDIGYVNLSRHEQFETALEAYALGMLATDMIYNVSNYNKYSINSPYEYVDLIQMRKVLEEYTMFQILSTFDADCDRLYDAYSKVKDYTDQMYAIFSEYVFNREYPISDIVPYGTDEWNKLFNRINKCLNFPL